MRFSENWLRTFVDPPCTSDELAHALTMAGLEVEAVEPAASDFDKVVVAEVLSVTAHPSADRLQVCLVNIGDAGHEPIQIVCGAPNVRVGIKVPCALIGAHLSDDFVIKQAKLLVSSNQSLIGVVGRQVLRETMLLATPGPPSALAGSALLGAIGWLSNGGYGVVGTAPVVLAA